MSSVPLGRHQIWGHKHTVVTSLHPPLGCLSHHSSQGQSFGLHICPTTPLPSCPISHTLSLPPTAPQPSPYRTLLPPPCCIPPQRCTPGIISHLIHCILPSPPLQRDEKMLGTHAGIAEIAVLPPPPRIRVPDVAGCRAEPRSSLLQEQHCS